MIVLGIESSCDETGIALYDGTQKKILAHELHSQVKTHALYGGVVPELASRDHIAHIAPLIEKVVKEASISYSDIDSVAYTAGPGLGGSLLVGASVACGLALALNKPIIEVHHLEGHLLSPFLSEPDLNFPFLALLVSGGHTQILLVKDIGDYELLGESVDDAVGEAFDKVGKLLGLEYPAGALISSLAEEVLSSPITFPRPMIGSKDLNMSFSGLKTAVLTEVMKLTQNGKIKLTHLQICEIAFAFQKAVVEVLTVKVKAALKKFNYTKVVVAGGVGANRALRKSLLALEGIAVFFPPVKWCTDNGAMIAYAGAQHLKKAHKVGALQVNPRWSLCEN